MKKKTSKLSWFGTGAFAIIGVVYIMPILICLLYTSVKTEFMLKDSYGMDESLNQQFENYYSNMRNLKAAKAVDVCYKILGTAIEKRLENAEKKENKGSKEYIAAAVAYIDEHLDNDCLLYTSWIPWWHLDPERLLYTVRMHCLQ